MKLKLLAIKELFLEPKFTYFIFVWMKNKWKFSSIDIFFSLIYSILLSVQINSKPTNSFPLKFVHILGVDSPSLLSLYTQDSWVLYIFCPIFLSLESFGLKRNKFFEIKSLRIFTNITNVLISILKSWKNRFTTF
jgi:hypothetical protein